MGYEVAYKQELFIKPPPSDKLFKLINDTGFVRYFYNSSAYEYDYPKTFRLLPSTDPEGGDRSTHHPQAHLSGVGPTGTKRWCDGIFVVKKNGAVKLDNRSEKFYTHHMRDAMTDFIEKMLIPNGHTVGSSGMPLTYPASNICHTPTHTHALPHHALTHHRPLPPAPWIRTSP